VKTAASRYGLKQPRIVVTNTIIPNAAAAGPNLRLGTIMVTTGIMTQLDDDELMSIIGHELSHLKSHDTLVMGLLSNIEYLLRFYLFWPYLFTIGFYSYFLYSFLSIGLIYFFGKFVEGRADLDSAKVIGQPQILAEALKKIAFTRLFPLNKREPEFKGYRKSEWLQFDPHPPTYFRIARLENLQEPEKINNTFLKSIRDSINDFLG
jgi:heat shock protein HtpX